MGDRWRVGRHLGRTLYRQIGDVPSDSDEFLGLMETKELAEFVVHLVNSSGELVSEWITTNN